MKKILAAMLSGAVVLAALGGCGTYTDDGTSSSGSSGSAETSSAESGTGESTDTSADTSADPMTFTFIGGQPVTLNPILSQSSDDGNSFYLLQSSLFRYTADGVQNEICETYDVSDDGLTYTFHLRDANWSDGEPITAEHFAYALYCYTPRHPATMTSPAPRPSTPVPGAGKMSASRPSTTRPSRSPSPSPTTTISSSSPPAPRRPSGRTSSKPRARASALRSTRCSTAGRMC